MNITHLITVLIALLIFVLIQSEFVVSSWSSLFFFSFSLDFPQCCSPCWPAGGRCVCVCRDVCVCVLSVNPTLTSVSVCVSGCVEHAPWHPSLGSRRFCVGRPVHQALTLLIGRQYLDLLSSVHCDLVFPNRQEVLHHQNQLLQGRVGFKSSLTEGNRRSSRSNPDLVVLLAVRSRLRGVAVGGGRGRGRSPWRQRPGHGDPGLFSLVLDRRLESWD